MQLIQTTVLKNTFVLATVTFLVGCQSYSTTLSTTTKSKPTPTPASQLPPPPAGRTAVLIDDLEDGNRFNQFRGTWFSYDDRYDGGDSQVNPIGYSPFRPQPGGPMGSKRHAHISGKVTTTYPDGYVGMGTDLNNPNDPVDITGYDGLEFWARGDGKTYRLKLRSPVTGDYDDYGYDLVTTEDWQHYIIDFDSLEQEGKGKQVSRDEALSQIISITWHTINQPHESVELAVDNLRFLKSVDGNK